MKTHAELERDPYRLCNSSIYIINKKPMIPRTDFHCITTWVARSLGEIR